MNLQEEIKSLISSKREGDYWDFKECVYTDNGALLHDILCMANSLHKGNRYIILGVSDPKVGAEIKGLPSGRKQQHEYHDFLSNLQDSFAGNYIPEIELRTLILEDKEIDVLVVFDRPFKPYYLNNEYSEKKDNRYKTVRANYIYTRINDRNTAIDKSADIHQIEKMWRQRLGIDLSPKDRMINLLFEPSQWKEMFDEDKEAYHLYTPEFRIVVTESEPAQEPYSYFFLNPESFLCIASFMYHSTTLFKLKMMYLDEKRTIFPVPEIKSIILDNDRYHYFYYKLDTESGAFYSFLHNNAEIRDIKIRIEIIPFLVFKNDKEQAEFEEFLKTNITLLQSISTNPIIDGIEKQRHIDGPIIMSSSLNIYRIIKMYHKWKYGIDIDINNSI